LDLKAIATDLDGTLTDGNLLLNLRAVNLIRRLRSVGMSVILCTGRDAGALRVLVPYIGTDLVGVAEGGAVVGRFDPYDLNLKCLSDSGRIRHALEVLRAAYGPAVKVVPVPGRKASRILVPGFNAEEANRLLSERRTGACIVSSGLALELTDAAVSKGTGLQVAAGLLDFELDSILAVGDSPNHIEMFRAVGWSAAVANAPPPVKAEASYVCRKTYGEGFIEGVLETLRLFRPDLPALTLTGL